MSNKKSKFLLQIMMGMGILISANLCCMDELSRFKDVCVKNMTEFSNICAEKASQLQDACVSEYNRLEPICIENAVKTAIYCDDAMQSIDAEKAFLGIGAMSSVAGAVSGYYLSKAVIQNDAIAGATALTSAVFGASLIRGMYNVRDQNAMLQEIEAQYGLVPAYDWYQLPGYYATKLICYGSDVQAVEQVSPFIQMIKSKVEKMTDARIFGFTAFIDQFPHTGVNHSYCIAKKYFDGSQSATLSDLQSNVDNYIAMIEQDFKKLMKLTELSNSFKLPVTLHDFHAMELFLNQYKQHLIINSLLGACGYSPLQNGQRVKDLMLEIIKYRAFLLNLKEILATCSDSKDTQLKDADGNLNFTLQHVHHVNAVEIR